MGYMIIMANFKKYEEALWIVICVYSTENYIWCKPSLLETCNGKFLQMKSFFIWNAKKKKKRKSSIWGNHKQMLHMPQNICKKLLWECKWEDCFVLMEGSESFMQKSSIKIQPGAMLDFRRNRLVEHSSDRWTDVRTKPEQTSLACLVIRLIP